MLIVGFWFALAGLLMLGIVVSTALPRWVPFTTAQIYLGVGALLAALGLLHIDLVAHAAPLERATEVAILVSLFGAGLRLRLPFGDGRWRAPVRLATVAMVLTVGGIALLGVYGLALPWGAAILLGAVLAPTDPVLASEVQVQHADDRDRFRVALTGEAGLNDGTAFPFVMLGLGLLGAHDLGASGLRWLGVDVLWATAAGLAVGALVGTVLPRAVLALRVRTRETGGLDDFVALGVLALAYGGALLLHGYGFLAAFVAGVAFRRVERTSTGGAPVAMAEADARATAADLVGTPAEDVRTTVATTPEHAPAHLASEALHFMQHLERLGELALVVVLGAALVTADLPRAALWFVPALLLVVRPIGVFGSLLGSALPFRVQRRIAWFGMRGIGSLYYLTYAVTHGFDGPDAERLAAITLAVLAASVFVHGLSARLTLRA